MVRGETMSARDEPTELRLEVMRLKATLHTLIAWLPQSRPQPLSVDEARRLVKMLEGGSAATLQGRYLQRFPPS
jgi:hypothetical protein